MLHNRHLIFLSLVTLPIFFHRLLSLNFSSRFPHFSFTYLHIHIWDRAKPEKSRYHLHLENNLNLLYFKIYFLVIREALWMGAVYFPLKPWIFWRLKYPITVWNREEQFYFINLEPVPLDRWERVWKSSLLYVRHGLLFHVCIVNDSNGSLT